MASLPILANCAKKLSGMPRWQENGSAWKIARISLISEIEGLDGLFLRLKAPNLRDGSGFLLQVEYQPGDARGTEPLSRLEWRVGHTNPNLGPPEYRLLECPGTHFHSFDLNYIDGEDRMRRSNLPLAEPVEPDPDTFEELLAFGRKSLRISDLDEISRPEFEGKFLP